MTGRGERLFALLLRLYPRAFRDRYRGELLAFFRQDREHPKYGSGVLRPLRFWTATTRDVVRTTLSHRRDRRRDAAALPASHTSALDRWRRDVRVAWRGLWSAPGVTLPALAVLIIGIGASTAIFSVVDAVALRGLPYPGDDRLVIVRETSSSGAIGSVPVRPQTYFEWRKSQRAFEHFGAAANGPRLTTIDGSIETLTSVRMTASLLQVLNVAPAIGRPFQDLDERLGARPVVILSDRLWRGRFQADPAIVGRTLAHETGEAEIVGVMPPDFRYPVSTSADLWMPWVPTAAQTVRGRTRHYMLTVIGRLKPAVSIAQAETEMTRLNEGLAAEDDAWFGSHGIAVRSMQDTIVGASVRSWMLLLLAAVTGVLLIACLNVANLLVARAVARAPELAVRTALGASRWDLSRALLLESLILSLIGAAGGVLAAIWGVEILTAALPANVPRLATVALDLRVITVAVAAAMATGLAFGTLPALQVSRPDLVRLVGQGTRAHSGGRASHRVRTGLVIGEVAVASVLLVGSGMFLASFMRVTGIDLGFDPRHVIGLTGGIVDSSMVRPASTPEGRAETASGQSLLVSAMDRLRAVPGVVGVAALSGGRPLGGSSLTLAVQHVDRKSAPFEGDDEPFVRCVTPGYLDVLRGVLVRGRWIQETDVVGTEPVIVLSDAAARQYFDARDPIGERILLDGDPYTIVGVVRSMRFRGPETEIRPEVFVPLFQGASVSAELMVRTDRDPTLLVPALHGAIRAVMPAATLQATPLEQDYAKLLAQRKFNMVVLVVFGVVAVVVAAAGIYGLMSVLVQQRRREIGVRVALGAEPFGILKMILRRATTLMIVGLALGVAAAALVERLVRAFLFEPQPHDPIVYGSAALALFAAGLAAAFGPARRAARVDPMVALRTE